ncbi:M23 family metallopeptidase [Candidatus Bipolaricaulota bacterium]|nr:M23 family metallopeptidase [Candidatus Bipolaricaulota bacterium]
MSENPFLVVALALLFLPLLFVPFLSSDPVGGPVVPITGTRATWSMYTVQAGDTLSGIAKRTGVPADYLLASNDVDPTRLQPGQQLLLPVGGVLHIVRPGQAVADIAASYGVAEGAIRVVNDLSGEPLAGTRVFVPAPPVVPQATAVALGKGSGTRFVWPARGPISSPYGPRIHPIHQVPSFHAGIDLAIAEGTRVHAAAPGRVATAGWEGGYGLLVVLDHGDGYTTYYGHLSQLLVEVGQFVEIGQAIALSGNTGLSTGPHLHFEVRCDGVAVDPLSVLP